MTNSLVIAAFFALAAVLPPAAVAADSGGKLEQAFKKADKDNDGSLDREEAKALPRVAKNFDKIDADKSGTVTLAEIHAAGNQAAKQIEEQDRARFQAADKDHDGTLDREEAKVFPRIAKNFDKIDADKSGTISQEEIRNYARAQRSTAKADASKH
jgi:Ca2+-binding EF-hand superfamily protein